MKSESREENKRRKVQEDVGKRKKKDYEEQGKICSEKGNKKNKRILLSKGIKRCDKMGKRKM